jgi:hypothetical protein
LLILDREQYVSIHFAPVPVNQGFNGCLVTLNIRLNQLLVVQYGLFQNSCWYWFSVEVFL